MKSLFTNVPLDKTIEIILDRIYKDKVISTSLKPRTLKKLIKDTCSKTAFMLDGVIYEQIDGVSMGASLGPVLANIIMTEMERCVVDKLIESGKIKFYARYVDDTVLLVKPEDIDDILQQFNNFHRNLEFTVDRFKDLHSTLPRPRYPSQQTIRLPYGHTHSAILALRQLSKFGQ